MDGLLLVDKPEGISSFGVVARVRRIAYEVTDKKIKIGHTGTLDPAASGLLVLVIGTYTKKAGDFSKLDKTYLAELTLGVTSDTGDREGPLRAQGNNRPTKKAVEAILRAFEGEIHQIPPIHSAVKINGQRAYKLARKGRTVKLEPRKVTIHKITDIQYEYPKIWFKTRVSSGTYIRTLAEDIGEKLGTGAYLSALRRSRVGKFDIKDAVELARLDAGALEARLVKG